MVFNEQLNMSEPNINTNSGIMQNNSQMGNSNMNNGTNNGSNIRQGGMSHGQNMMNQQKNNNLDHYSEPKQSNKINQHSERGGHKGGVRGNRR